MYNSCTSIHGDIQGKMTNSKRVLITPVSTTSSTEDNVFVEK